VPPPTTAHELVLVDSDGLFAAAVAVGIGGDSLNVAASLVVEWRRLGEEKE